MSGQGLEGHLKFETTPEAEAECRKWVTDLTARKPLSSFLPKTKFSDKRLPMVIISDFEPDDLMAIAQLWSWKAKQLGVHEEEVRPVVVMVADFYRKDRGTVFEKKLLMARLMLGLEVNVDYRVLTHEPTKHPLGKDAYDGYAPSLAHAAAEIAGLANDTTREVEWYIIAPGHGHLNALAKKLEASHPEQWKNLHYKCQVVTYTGSFNSRQHFPDDFVAMRNLCGGALVDISKFVFFGRDHAHPMTTSVNTFASDELAAQVSREFPRVSAILREFNNEFTGALIDPWNMRLFSGHGRMSDTRTQDEINRFVKDIEPLYLSQGVQAYAQALMNAPELWAKVAKPKRSTVAAFATGTMDMPLCDQVCFAFQWLRDPASGKAAYLNVGDEGYWWVDPESGFSGVQDYTLPRHQFSKDISAIQPTLSAPVEDQAKLLEIRATMEERLTSHIRCVQQCLARDVASPDGAAAQEATQEGA